MAGSKADVSTVEEALFDLEACISVPEAEKIMLAQGVKVTRPSIIAWIHTYKIGKKVGGRYYIDPVKLSLLLRGKLKRA